TSATCSRKHGQSAQQLTLVQQRRRGYRRRIEPFSGNGAIVVRGLVVIEYDRYAEARGAVGGSLDRFKDGLVGHDAETYRFDQLERVWPPAPDLAAASTQQLECFAKHVAHQ